LEPIPSARVSSGENLVHLLNERRRRFWRCYLVEGVVGGDTLGQAAEGLLMAWRGCSVQVASSKGIAELMPRRPNLCWRPGVASCLSSWLLAADCGGGHCFAAVGAAWDSVRGRRLRQRQGGTIWLAADCGGQSSYVVATPVRSIVGRRRKRQHGLLAWRRRLCARVGQRDDVA